MSNRNERRARMKRLGPTLGAHPVARRLERNVRLYGEQATEVCRFDSESPEGFFYFDVFSMRRWAREHAQQVVMPLDWQRVTHLIETGAIERERITEHTLHAGFSPIIVGRMVGPGDQILDGAHRYVTTALAAQAAGLGGQPLPVPTYLLQPKEWRRFLIPERIAQLLNFDTHFDAAIEADTPDFSGSRP